MFFQTFSAGTAGIDGFIVEVQTDLSTGFPHYSLVGLPDSSVKESKERVRSAIKNSGYNFPLGRITINLAPAHLRKEGPSYDLSVAVGILTASKQWSVPSLTNTLLVGELSLDGQIKTVQGVLPMALAAKENGFQSLVVPPENAEEASLSGLQVYPLVHLQQFPQIFEQPPYMTDSVPSISIATRYPLDFAHIIGQSQAKRGLEIAAAGFHNILFIGPPGTGKTLLASTLPSILPALSYDEWLEINKIYSAAGKNQLFNASHRPFRSPHHTITPTALVGGGGNLKPGEITLAHHGVLFLDEICEYPRPILELLRQPLEERKIQIHRNRQCLTFPASFMLVGSMNPCPCGYYGFSDNHHICTCSMPIIRRYRRRLSGPLLDRFDIQMEIPRLEADDFMRLGRKEEPSETIRKRVLQAIQLQKERFKRSSTGRNSEMTLSEIKAYCSLTDEAQQLLKAVYDRFKMNHRSHHRILKLARTIADLESRECISEIDIAEAVQFRTLEKNIF